MLILAPADPPDLTALLYQGDPSDPDVLRGKRILLLEDEVFIAVELRRGLEAAGAKVVYARTLARAHRALDQGGLDGAVLDVTLSATETCEPIAGRLRAAGVPFLLHSGDLDRQGEVLANLEAPVVAKPAAAEVVANRLGALLREPQTPPH